MSGPEHMYEQIAAVLREQILMGDLGPGSRLPTQEALSEQFGVSRIVARRALELLEAEGLIDRAKGAKGATVRVQQPVVRRSMRHYGPVPSAPFADEALTAERIPRFSHSSQHDRAGVGVARRLKIDVGNPTMRTDYLSYADDHPVMLVTSHEPLAITGGTPIEWPEDGPLMNAGIVPRFASIGMRPTRILERIRTRMPRPSEVEQLRLRPGTPVMVIVRVSSCGETPVETGTLVLAGDQFELEYDLTVTAEEPGG